MSVISFEDSTSHEALSIYNSFPPVTLVTEVTAENLDTLYVRRVMTYDAATGTGSTKQSVSVTNEETFTSDNVPSRIALYTDDQANSYEVNAYHQTGYVLRAVWDTGKALTGVASNTQDPAGFSSYHNFSTAALGILNDFFTFYNQDPYVYSATITSNIPIFRTELQARNYISTGSLSGCLNYGGNQTVSIKTKRPYYIFGNSFEYDELGNKTTKFSPNRMYLKIPDGKEIAGYYDADSSYIIHLTTNAGTFEGYTGSAVTVLDTDYSIMNTIPINDSWYPNHSIILPSGVTLDSAVSTNIPIFGSSEEATGYIAGTVPASAAVMGYAGERKVNLTGDECGDQAPEEYTISNAMNTVFIASASNLATISQTLYSTTAGVIEDILEGLELFGNNPIEFINDLYYCPIDVSGFCVYGVQSYVMFGSYKCEGVTDIKKVTSNGKVADIFSQYIQPTYDDFREYQCIHYSLYLPFYGIFPLDTAMISGKILSCKAVYDLRAHILKYYLFADSRLIDTKECSLGVQMPIIATDTVGKAQQNISAISSLVATGAGMAAGAFTAGATGLAGAAGIGSAIGGAVTGAGSSLIGDVAGNAGGIMGAVESITAQPAVIKCGNSSSATACSDIMYPFLIIDEQLSEEPDALHSQYGKPCDRIAMLSESSGFTVCEDVRIEGTMTETEKRMLENLCRNGIII